VLIAPSPVILDTFFKSGLGPEVCVLSGNGVGSFLYITVDLEVDNIKSLTINDMTCTISYKNIGLQQPLYLLPALTSIKTSIVIVNMFVC